MSTFPSISDLISAWPSLAEFAADAGVSYEAGKQMRRRGSIGVEYWPAVITAAKTRGIEGVSADVLMRLHAPAESAAQ